MKGKVLDIGCGAGVMASVMSKLSPKVKLTLSDVNAAAVESSRATLAANGIEGSDRQQRLLRHHWPFRHDHLQPAVPRRLQTSLTAAETLIRGAVKHLPIGGQLRIVANAFLPYPDILDATFGSHEVLAQNGRFKVYRATVGRPPRAPKKK